MCIYIYIYIDDKGLRARWFSTKDRARPVRHPGDAHGPATYKTMYVCNNSSY